MITKLRNILGLTTLEENLARYNSVNEGIQNINSQTDDLYEHYYNKMVNYNHILKSEEYSDEIKKSVKERYDNFLQDQKKTVIGLVNKRHKLEKELSSLLKNDSLNKAVQELNSIEKAKYNYKTGKISKNVYNDIIKAKKGKVHYSDNFVFWNDKLLIIQRTTDDTNANTWVLPGGHVDAGESHEDAAIRELKEETGLEVESPVLVGTYNNDDVMIEYYTSYIESEIEPSVLLDTSEHQSYKWIYIHKGELDEYDFPFNMKENIKKILFPEEKNYVKINKAVNLFISGAISKEVLSDIVKARSGIYSDTPENRRLKRVGQQYGTKGTQDTPEQKESKKEPETDKKQSGEQSIEEYARQSSETALQNAAKGGDEELRIAAKKELDRREKEESAYEFNGKIDIVSELKEKAVLELKGMTLNHAVSALESKDFKDLSKDDKIEVWNNVKDSIIQQSELMRREQDIPEWYKEIKSKKDSSQPEKESVETEKMSEEGKPPASVEEMKKRVKELRNQDTDDLNEIENISKEINELIQKIKQSSEKERFSSGEAAGLSEEESRAIIDYTGNSYKEINRQLRNKKVSAETQSAVNKISNGLSKLPDHKGKVFRGMAIPDDIDNMLEKWKKGGVITMDAFTSTSTNKNVASKFGDFQIEIESKTGKDISSVSEYGKKESEILFDVNAKFQVKSLKVKKVKTPFGEKIISVIAVIKEV